MPYSSSLGFRATPSIRHIMPHQAPKTETNHNMLSVESKEMAACISDAGLDWLIINGPFSFFNSFLSVVCLFFFPLLLPCIDLYGNTTQ
jgi:hypothetical protein